MEITKLVVPFKAYKVFNPDWTCLTKQYEVGKEYREGKIKICEYGIHACLNLSDCFDYYSFDSNNKVAETSPCENFPETSFEKRFSMASPKRLM